MDKELSPAVARTLNWAGGWYRLAPSQATLSIISLLHQKKLWLGFTGGKTEPQKELAFSARPLPPTIS
jgi:hypothetical protein